MQSRLQQLRRPGRFWPAILVVLFLMADLAGFVHQAAEQHARCEAHGELVHVGAPGQDTPADDPEHDEDEHCKLCPAAWAPATTPSGTQIVVAVPMAPDQISTARHHPIQARPLLRLAPKTSPPLA